MSNVAGGVAMRGGITRLARGLAIVWLLIVLAMIAHQVQFWRGSRLDTDVMALLPTSERTAAADRVLRRLADSVAQADTDARARMLREQQVDARQLVESVQAALAVDGDLLEADERKQVDECLQAAIDAQNAQDVDTVKDAVQALSAATDDFAARRMDRSIRAALAGRKLDEIA